MIHLPKLQGNHSALLEVYTTGTQYADLPTYLASRKKPMPPYRTSQLRRNKDILTLDNTFLDGSTDPLTSLYLVSVIASRVEKSVTGSNSIVDCVRCLTSIDQSKDQNSRWESFGL